MLSSLSSPINRISWKTWGLLILIYLLPSFIDFIDHDDQFFNNMVWFLFPIPTLIIANKKGIKYGGIATSAALIFFLISELLETDGIGNQEFIFILEIVLMNLLITLLIGILVKKNHEKQAELRETRNLLESIFHHLDIAIWSEDKNQHSLLSKGMEKIYGLTREKALSNMDFWKKAIHPEDQSIAKKIEKNMNYQEAFEYEYRIVRPNGEIRWIRDQGLPAFNENRELERYDGAIVDITKQKELECNLKESEERYKSLLEKALVGVFLIQNNELVYANEWITNFFGVSQSGLLGGNFIDHIKEEDQSRVITSFQKLMDGQESFLIDEIRVVSPDGITKYLEIQATLTTINGASASASAIIGIAVDITDKKKANDKLEYMAFHDDLTGLKNMHYLNHTITKEFNEYKALGMPTSLMFFNLDRFKLINDSFGHAIGDQLLKMVSKRLICKIKHPAKVIRAGGDEFIIYLPGSNRNSAKDFSRFLLNAFSEPFYLEEQEIRIAASIGIAISEEADFLEEAVQKASSAVHVAKEMGRNQFQIYSPEFGEMANRKLQVEQGLKKAFEQERLEVFYQPKLDLFTERITGMEALLRWNDPILGVVSPVEFIPIAEETGSILSIGKWVLETACNQNSEWQRDGYPPMQVCVNISSLQFLQSDFVHMIEQIVKDSELSPEYLNLEITERIALYNIDDAIEKLEQLKQLGIRISLDDFGTGYSSLSYIQSLPIDFLKIDRAFLNGILRNKQDAAIMDSIISLAHSLNLIVVVEGVENEQQLNYLGEIGCDEIQGFYFAMPMPAVTFKQFLDEVKVNEWDPKR